jgi:hypothetical protein
LKYGKGTGSVQDRRELPQAFWIRAESLAHREPIRPDPEEVASLRRRGGTQGRQDRDVELLEGSGQGRFLPAPQFLSHPQDDGSLVRDDRGIVHEDCIGSFWLGKLVISNVHLRSAKQGDESIVLRLRSREVGSGGVSPLLRIRHRKGGIRSADQHRPEQGHHALRAKPRDHRRGRNWLDPHTLCSVIRSALGGA